MGLDLVFVLALQGGVAGVATATVISQVISAALCALYMLARHPRLRPEAASFRLDKSILGEYLRIGLPMCFQSLVLGAVSYTHLEVYKRQFPAFFRPAQNH